MQDMNRLPRLLLAASWIVFALIALSYQPVWVGAANILKCLIGLLGVGFVCANAFSDRRWLLFASVTSVAVLLLTYIAEFVARVLSYTAVDSEFGVPQTVWLKISTLFLASRKLASDGSILQATVELYWTLGMPVLQLVLGAILVWQLTMGAKATQAPL